MKMYRLRSTSKLFDGEYPELSEQIIFFSPPSDFNDPLEGEVEIIFHGDSIVWENFFKHFLLCMEHKVALATLYKPEERKKFNESGFPIFSSEASLPTSLYRQCFSTIKDRFFLHEEIIAWIQYLGSRRTPIREEQLLSIFTYIADIALESILFGHEKAGLQPQTDFLVALQNRVNSAPHRKMINIMNVSEEKHIDVAMEVGGKIIQEVNLIAYCNLGEKAELINWGYFASDFPSEYVAHLQRLVFPNWYAASFMGKFPKSTDLWGHYADNHKGACLIFNAERIDKNSRLYIEIERPIGYDSTGKIMKYSPVYFNKVNYENEKMQVDFFKRLWTQSTHIIINEWYMNAAGQKSPLISEVNPSEEVRQEYWNIFLKEHTTKTKDWEKEDEYRLLLYSSLFNFPEKKDRALHYQFNSLAGIVFGIRMPIKEKAKIIRIIHDKCKENGRKDFSFYQARYDKKKCEVIYDELSLLKFE